MNATSLSLCLFLDALPWNFGPYQQQGGLLALGLIARGHSVSWASTRGWSRPLEDGDARVLSSPAEAAEDISTSPPADAAEAMRYEAIRFIGGGRQVGGASRLLASNVNRVVERFGCSAAIAIMDVNKVHDNEPFGHRMALWYPNHNSAPLPRIIAGALNALSDIVSLAPSDARMLQAELEAHPNPGLPSSKVTYIPHIVQLPAWMGAEREGGGGGGDASFRPFKAATRAAWRVQYGVPADAFMVLVNCGNYEMYNRKSLDVSLQAFEQLHAREPRSFLYLKAMSSLEVLRRERTSLPVTTKAPGLELDDLLAALAPSFPTEAVRVDTAMRSFLVV